MRGNKALALILALLLISVMALTSCGQTPPEDNAAENQAESNGKVMILFTSDVHCGVDEGFGYHR